MVALPTFNVDHFKLQCNLEWSTPPPFDKLYLSNVFEAVAALEMLYGLYFLLMSSLSLLMYFTFFTMGSGSFVPVMLMYCLS